MHEPLQIEPHERRAIQAGRWFAALPATDRHDLLRLARVERFADGEGISARGESHAEWFACAAGTVRVSASGPGGKPFTLAYVRPGVWFGGPGAFDQGPATHDLHAVGPTSMFRVARDDFLQLLAGSPALCLAVFRLQARHLRDLYAAIEFLSSESLGPRLAHQLLTLARAYGVPVDGLPGAIRLDIPISQSRLAEMVGYSRQRVNAELKRLEREGVLGLAQRTIVIRQPGRLRDLKAR